LHWAYKHSLTANITEMGPDNSILAISLGSLEQVPELISDGSFLCIYIASNDLGSVGKSFILNVSGTEICSR
jgi:hypothetical protein